MQSSLPMIDRGMAPRVAAMLRRMAVAGRPATMCELTAAAKFEQLTRLRVRSGPIAQKGFGNLFACDAVHTAPPSKPCNLTVVRTVSRKGAGYGSSRWDFESP